jgi:hypothetical protein
MSDHACSLFYHYNSRNIISIMKLQINQYINCCKVFHNKEIHDLYKSPGIRVVKS